MTLRERVKKILAIVSQDVDLWYPPALADHSEEELADLIEKELREAVDEGIKDFVRVSLEDTPRLRERGVQVTNQENRSSDELQRVNEKVARKLGWVPIVIPYSKSGEGIDWHGWLTPTKEHRDCPSFSEDIKAAWEIFDAVASQGGAWDLEHNKKTDNFKCTLKPSYTKAYAETAPLAICKAFLAMEEEK